MSLFQVIQLFLLLFLKNDSFKETVSVYVFVYDTFYVLFGGTNPNLFYFKLKPVHNWTTQVSENSHQYKSNSMDALHEPVDQIQEFLFAKFPNLRDSTTAHPSAAPLRKKTYSFFTDSSGECHGNTHTNTNTVTQFW